MRFSRKSSPSEGVKDYATSVDWMLHKERVMRKDTPYVGGSPRM